MNELDKITLEMLDQIKTLTQKRKLHFFEWAEYYSILQENIKLGLSKEIKSEFMELLLRDDLVQIREEEQEIIKQMQNELCFKYETKSRLKRK